MFIKRLFLIFFCFIGLNIIVHGQTIIKIDKSKISFASLNNKVESLMKAANVEGLAITVFNNNEPVYKKTFGYKRIDTKEPIKTSTNIYGASLSKPFLRCW